MYLLIVNFCIAQPKAQLQIKLTNQHEFYPTIILPFKFLASILIHPQHFLDPQFSNLQPVQNLAQLGPSLCLIFLCYQEDH